MSDLTTAGKNLRSSMNEYLALASNPENGLQLDTLTLLRNQFGAVSTLLRMVERVSEEDDS